MIDFVDLDRHFAPILKDKDAELDFSLNLGRKYGNWLNWTEMLACRRVVLLAEALSGKTKELEQQASKLKQQDIPAFYVRIEDLVDRGFVKALRADDAHLFDSWKQGKASDAWFFLDSVDEARLNNKSFEMALRVFGNELGIDNLNRSFVIVSCRVSDWKGKSDRQALQTELPFVLPAAISSQHDFEQMLLAPIFDSDTARRRTNTRREELNPNDLLVVQLVPLTDEQKLKMTEAAKIDGQLLLQAINRSGLNAMAERPGDFIELISYWGEYSRLDSLSEMTEEGVRRKLREEDPHRRGLLSLERARDGAQRLAAALVLAKTFALKAPGQEPDPSLSKGAIDPFIVLSDWSPPEVNALLRTGVFAPSTYGRVKFHHRTTQEFLAACWLRSLREQNCPLSAIQQLLFVEQYGVKTAVPSLLVVAAWLSQWVPEVCKELIERAPIALIVHADPKSLSLATKESLLRSYAHLDAAGRLDYEYIDSRAAWMFSDRALANAITLAWQVNSKPGFRLNLLHFIDEGRIAACVHLARQAAAEQSQDDMRIVATRAMVACDDRTGLMELAQQLIKESNRLSARLAPRLAEMLYPKYMNIAGILTLIEHSEQARQFSSDGFASYLVTLHAQAQSRSDQKRLVIGVAELVIGSGPLYGLNKIAERYTELGNGVAELAEAELACCRRGEVDDGMLRLLMAVERVPAYYRNTEGLPALRGRVRGDERLNRQLMWASVAAWRIAEAPDDVAIRFYQIGPFFGRQLWGTDTSDLEWLAGDAKERLNENERRIAFSAMYSALQDNTALSLQSYLETFSSGDPVLSMDLAEFVKAKKSYISNEEQHHAEIAENGQREKAKQSWVDFRDELVKTPAILYQTDTSISWRGSLLKLYKLTNWLKDSVIHSNEDIAPSLLLGRVFNPEVADYYVAGMREAWRRIEPIRPIVSGSYHTSQFPSLLALDALTLDSQGSDWATDLSDADATTAIRHAMMAGTIKSAWVDKLVQERRNIALPVIIAAVRYEFRSNNQFNDILSSAAYNDVPGQDAVAKTVFNLLKRREPDNRQTLDYCTRILARCSRAVTKKDVIALAKKRLVLHLGTGEDDSIFAYLRVLASVDEDGLATFVLAQLVRRSAESDAEFGLRVQHWLGSLFDRHTSSGVALDALQNMRVGLLAQLLKSAYLHIRPDDDKAPGSGSSVTGRDLAEGARNSLLTAVMNRRETAAYTVLIQMAASPEFSDHAMRFLELAHRKAHADADMDPWTAAEVDAFGRTHSAPAKTGAQLLRLILAVLSDISAWPDSADASSLPLLALADDEEKVQQWLAERLQERSSKRYHTHREPKVAARKEPDILVTSMSGPGQVAIEIKNANKGWTVKQFENAITNQLAGNYLLPDERRHGILLISLHKARTWRVNGNTWNFDRLISHLTCFAAQVTSNRKGPVEVNLIAINAWRP